MDGVSVTGAPRGGSTYGSDDKGTPLSLPGEEGAARLRQVAIDGNGFPNPCTRHRPVPCAVNGRTNVKMPVISLKNGDSLVFFPPGAPGGEEFGVSIEIETRRHCVRCQARAGVQIRLRFVNPGAVSFFPCYLFHQA